MAEEHISSTVLHDKVDSIDMIQIMLLFWNVIIL